MPFPLASNFAKMFMSENAFHAPCFGSDNDLSKVLSIPMADQQGKLKIADELNAFLSINADILQKKSTNLASKKKAVAAMTCKTVDASMLTLGEFGLSAHGLKMIGCPFIVVMDHFGWSWNSRSWPLAGMPCIVLVLNDRFFATTFDIDTLASADLKSIVSMPQMKWFKGSDAKLLEKTARVELELSKAYAAYFPAGTIPMITCAPAADCVEPKADPNDAKGIAVVIPLLPQDAAGMVVKTQQGQFLVKQYVEQSLLDFGSDKQYDIVKESMNSWVSSWSK